MSIFNATIADIQSLSDEQAPKLIARLCQAEVKKYGYDTSLVTWGGDLRAKDGGVDVRVSFPDGSQHSSDWLKRRKSVAVQVKAVKSFSKADIVTEVENHNVMLSILNDVHGVYLIVSVKSSTADGVLQNNQDAIKNTLLQLNFKNITSDFYDARRIADWVNEHPSVFVWLKGVLGQPISGWKSYGAWAYSESDVTAKYILDDKTKLRIPTGIELTVIEGINELRKSLALSTSVRLVGLSGVGKTRLVQALFDKRIVTDAPCLEKEFVVYGDVSDSLEPQPQLMLESLVTKTSRAILVVDNCGSELHNKLTQMLTRHPSNQVSLLTVEYDIRDDQPDHTACYRLESSSNRVIEKIIKTKFSYLSSLDVQKIVDFSDGNARVAYALANTAQSSGELAQLKNDELFKRLFHQRHDPSNSALLATAKYASLVYSFNADNDELETLAQLSDQGTKAFRSSLSELARRGLLQSRGCWRAVLPHAIANNLAKLVLEELELTELARIFSNENKRFVRSFSRRLGYLHESTIAQDLVKDLLAPSGMFYLLENLSDDEKAMVINLAPVAPEAMLGCLEAAISRKEFCEKKEKSDDWNDLLFKLAYDSVLFKRAVSLLIHPCFNGLDKVTHLFTLVLSGTEATPEQRSSLIKDWLHSKDERLQKLGFSCLSQAFRFGGFSSSMNFDFGARKRTYGWEPKINHDYCVWYRPLLTLMDELYHEDKYKDEIRGLFLNSFSELWQLKELQGDLSNSFKIFAQDGLWLEAFSTIKNILYFRGNLSPLLAIVEPKTDFDQLSLLLCSEQIYRDRELSYQEQIDKAISFGKQWANATAWLSLLPCLLSDKAKNAYHFGYGMACEHSSMLNLLNSIKTTAMTEGVKPSLFVHGLLNGWNSIHPKEVEGFLQSTMTDDFWSQYVVSLQLSIKPYDANIAYARLLEKAQNATTSDELLVFMSLGSGCRLQDYSIDQLLELSKVIMSKPSGLGIVLDVWSMAISCAKDKDLDYQNTLRKNTQNLLTNSWGVIGCYGNNEYDLLNIMDYAYQCVSNSKLISSIIECFFSSNWQIVNNVFVNCVFYFIEKFPQEALNIMYSQQTQRSIIEFMKILDRNFIQYERDFNFDSNAIIAWCDNECDKLLFISSMFKFFKANDDIFYGGEESVINSLTLNLLKSASNHRAVLENIFKSFLPNHWSGSRANVMEKRMQLFDREDLSNHPTLQAFWLEQRALIEKSIIQDRQQELEWNKRESETFE